MGPGRGFGVCPLYSRVNHSCTPKVHANYNPSIGAHTLHAIRDIESGEEILTSYIDSAQPISERTDDLEKFRVDCYCPACKSTPSAVRSEKRRDRLQDIQRGLRAYDGESERGDHIPEILVPNRGEEALTIAEEAITLLKEEGLIGMTLAQ